MDEIKQKIKQILKENFDTDADDDQRLFHHLDSINYYRYVILIENNFKINVDKGITFININDTADYIYKKLNDN
jgi:acyl carrier protein